jgi:hypothetical protein
VEICFFVLPVLKKFRKFNKCADLRCLASFPKRPEIQIPCVSITICPLLLKRPIMLPDIEICLVVLIVLKDAYGLIPCADTLCLADSFKKPEYCMLCVPSIIHAMLHTPPDPLKGWTTGTRWRITLSCEFLNKQIFQYHDLLCLASSRKSHKYRLYKCASISTLYTLQATWFSKKNSVFRIHVEICTVLRIL